MALSQRLQLKQGQTLVMTPQLQQAIKLLQLSNLELAEFVEQELERNPLLEREEEPAERRGAEDRETVSLDSGADPVEIQISDDRVNVAADNAMDADSDSMHPDQAVADKESVGAATDWSQVGSGKTGFEGLPDDDSTPNRALTLREHLLDQLSIAALAARERMIGAYLIELADDDGYLRADLDACAQQLGAPEAEIERVLKTLQGFEPTGVMARNLKECLALQLRERDRYDPAMAALLDNLELLARHDYPRLRDACSVDSEDLNDMIAELRSLTPKPGLAFGGEPAAAIQPDVIIRERPGGGWAVELNSDTLPRVLVNSRYYAEINAAHCSEQERAFITECHQNASWLVKSLDQRARTILKVATEIVRQQDAFLAHGVDHLRPLNLKTVADAIQMHESTVSRVTSNKYAATPRGLFELKYFFTSSIASSDGGAAHSAEAVRNRIKTLIDAETATEILSDDRIVELLREAGIDIARRTVAKYREAMGIASSVQRRRMAKQSA
jgi:RNA polymerase sigma-54 factor